MKNILLLLLMTVGMAFNTVIKAEIVNPKVADKYPANLRPYILQTVDSIATSDFNKPCQIFDLQIDSVFTIKSENDKMAINDMAQKMSREYNELSIIVDSNQFPQDSAVYYKARLNAGRIITNALLRLKNRDEISGALYYHIIDAESDEEADIMIKLLNEKFSEIEQHYSIKYILDFALFVDYNRYFYKNIVFYKTK